MSACVRKRLPTKVDFSVTTVGTGPLSCRWLRDRWSVADGTAGQMGVTFVIEISSNLVNWSAPATEVSLSTNWWFTDPDCHRSRAEVLSAAEEATTGWHLVTKRVPW